MVVFGDEAHEVRDLPDDDAVGAGQAAGRCQVAAGVASLQGRRRRRAGANGTGAPQVGGVDVDQACGARCRHREKHTLVPWNKLVKWDPCSLI